MSSAPAGLLLFRLAGRRFAIDLGMVAEVSELPPFWPIPLAPPCFAGVINFHGGLVPLLDLACYLESGRAHPQGMVMVLDKRLCDLALWVDGVERIAGETPPVSDRTPADPLTKQLLTLRGEEIPLLDATALLERLENDLKGNNHTPFASTPA